MADMDLSMLAMKFDKQRKLKLKEDKSDLNKSECERRYESEESDE